MKKRSLFLCNLCLVNVLQAQLTSFANLTGNEGSTGENPSGVINPILSVTATAPNIGTSNGGEGFWASAFDVQDEALPLVANSTNVLISFQFTAMGLAPGETLSLSQLAFDYTQTRLTTADPRMAVFLDEGAGYGAALIEVDEVLQPGDGQDADSPLTVQLSEAMNVLLEQGETVTIGFVFRDTKSAVSSRTHLIDNLNVSGEILGPPPAPMPAAPLSDVTFTPFANLTGEQGSTGAAPSGFLSPFLQATVVSPEIGISSAGEGYFFDASLTSNGVPASSDNVLISFQFTATGLAPGDTIDLTELAFDYAQSNLAPASPEFALFIDEGAGYGAEFFRFDEVQTTSPQVNPIELNLNISLENGESVTFGLAFQDGLNAPSRIHLIDNFTINGNFDFFSNQPGIDLNNNGVSDVWEFQFDATNLVSDVKMQVLDFDGDGFSNLAEALAGTDPRSFDSRLALNVDQVVSPTDVVDLIFPTVDGKHYSIIGSETLAPGSWSEDFSIFGDGGEGGYLMDFSDGPERYFFRLGVSDLDADGDRLTRAEEEVLGALFDDDDATTVAGEDDYQRYKEVIQSAIASDIVITSDGGTTLYEDTGNRMEVTLTRVSSRGNGFLDLGVQKQYQVTDTTRVASNAASSNDYRVVDVNGNELTDGLITLPAGVASATIYVEATSDAIIESPEQMTITVGGRHDLRLFIEDYEQTMPSADFIAISQAGHFLAQASMGGTPETISALANEIQAKGLIQACEDWIDEQIALPRETTVTQDCFTHQATWLLDGAGLPSSFESVNIQNFELAWWGKMVQTNEQFRHRMAFTLSQVFVTSSAFWANQERSNTWRSYTSYYDMLADGAFGSHRALLEDVSYHPFMGVYLSSAQNRKADAALGTSPDENFAREIMQLFSCGVFTQDQNGEYLLEDPNDPDSPRLENYDNEDITELAEVFTGLGVVIDGDAERVESGEQITPREGTEVTLDNFLSPRFDRGSRYVHPMQMVQTHHDLSTKELLDGTILPAGQPGDTDIAQALDALAGHPSTAPHLSRLLIKRLTNSNPSNAYIGRVTEAWRGEGPYGNGTNDVGNLLSIFKAILLDPEARQGVTYTTDATTGELEATPINPVAGRIKEPILKWTQFYRFAQSISFDSDQYPRWEPLTKRSSNDQTPDFGQIPMRAPSVFNYYDSEHSPSVGDLAAAEVTFSQNLTAPEAEILLPFVIRQFESFYADVSKTVPGVTFTYDHDGVTQFSTEYNFIDYLYRKNESMGDFIDDLNLWLCNGQISPALKAELVTVANNNGGASKQNLAGILSIIFNSSEFSVTH